MRPKQFVIIAIVLFTLLSCDKSEFPQLGFAVDNIDYGDCKTNTKSVPDEYLELTTVDDYFLSINHINAVFNCFPGQIIVNADQSGNNISINEYSTDNLANCICPYDLGFTLGPLQYETYNITLKQANIEIISFEIRFKKNLDLKVEIE